MKIYPFNGQIVTTDNINHITDIPLCYINTNDVEFNSSVSVEDDLKKSKIKEVLPYQEVPLDTCLFTKDMLQIPYDEMIKDLTRINGKYIYLPKGSTVFTPKTFKYKVTGKKDMKIKSNAIYNIKTLIPNNINFAKKMMQIFGDASSRGVAPSNIFINNKDISINSITSCRLPDADMALFQLKDMNNAYEDDYFSPNDSVEVPFSPDDYWANSTANIIGFVSDEALVKEDDYKDGTAFIHLNEESDFKIMNPKIYEKVNIKTRKVFSIPKDTESIKYHTIFSDSEYTPALIEEHYGKGFAVYLSDELVKNPVSYHKVLYELFVYVYAKGYLVTNELEEWIADVMPDFIVKDNRLTKKDSFVSSLELHKMFSLNEAEISPYSVDIDKKVYPFVDFIGMDKYNLKFKKNTDGENSQYKDPVKKHDAISILTSNRTIIYINRFIYEVNENVEKKINISIKDNTAKIICKKIKLSKNGIHVKEDQTFTYILSSNKSKFTLYLVVKKNMSASYFELVDSFTNNKADGVLIATIEIKQTLSKKTVCDIRQRAGGLPENEKDNFNCFDIGHVLGNPYRRSGTFIVRLPKRLEINKDIIMKIIDQYSSAEEMPILIFE